MTLIKNTKFFLPLLFACSSAFASHQKLETSVYGPTENYLKSRSDTEVFQTSLPTWTQNELLHYTQSKNLSAEDQAFYNRQLANTYEDSDFIFNAHWKNQFTLYNTPTTRLLQLNAQTNPILSHTNRMYVPESHMALAGEFYTELYHFLSFDIKPYYFLHDIPGYRHFATKEMYGSVHINKLSFDVGKVALHWGNGAYQPMIFGDDYDPFFLLRIRNSEPIEFDNFLSVLGKIKFELMTGWLDDNRKFPNGHITGATLSFQPTDRFNFHLTQTVLYGGTGAPTNNPGIFFGDAFFDAKKGNNPANRNTTLGFRYRIPTIDIEPYADFYFEDCCGSPLLNPRDIQNLFGLYFPARGAGKKFDFTIEWVRSNYITYRHENFPYTQSGSTMGNPLGSDAQAFYLIGHFYHSKKLQFESVFAYELRGRQGRATSNQGFVPIQKVDPAFQMAEERNRFEQAIYYYAKPNWFWAVRGGIEHVNNENYLQGKYGWSGLFGLESTYNF